MNRKAIYVFSFFLMFFCTLSSAQEIDTVWFDGFEEDWIFSWHADNGIWDVGTPTSGPLQAFNGNYCAATILDGNYIQPGDSRLIRHKSFSVPPKSENPRLRFSYWLSFSTNDFGEAQLKTQSGEWQPVSIKMDNTGSGSWSHGMIDLSEFADSIVQIAFRFYSANDGNNYTNDVSSGWYIDNVYLVKGPYLFNDLEDFESGTGDWYVDEGTWELGSPENRPERSFSGQYCYGTNLEGNYQQPADSRLISPPFLVPADESNPRITYKYWMSYSSFDYGEIQIRTSESEWITHSIAMDNKGGDVWAQGMIDLSEFSDSIVQVAFRFQSRDDGNSYSRDFDRGWYIDDVKLITGPYVLNNPEGFESQMIDWWVDEGTWEYGRPESGPANPHSGQLCYGTNLKGNYIQSADSRLISPPFVVPTSSSEPSLVFWQWFSLSTNDYGEVQISTDDGKSWITLSEQPIVSNSGTWSLYYISLSDYGDSLVKVAMNFHARNDGNNYTNDVSSGWYVDDVMIIDNSGLEVYAGPDISIESCGTGQINATVSGGKEPYNIEWIPADGLDDPSSLSPLATLSDTTIYTLRITDANGCFRTDRITVNANCEAPNVKTDILSFGLGKPPQKGDATINSNTRTIELKVQYGADLTNLTPTFTLSDGATATVNGIEQQSGLTANDFTNPVIYKITAEDRVSTQEWTVTITFAEVDNPEFLTYGFGTPPQLGDALIDVDFHTVQIKVGNGTDLTNLVAIFTLPNNASATIKGVEQISGSTVNNFTDPVLYTITAEDKITAQEWTVTVIEAALYETDILSFTFGEPPQLGEAIIDPVVHTVNVLVENGTELTDLVARFILSEGASAKINGIDQTSETTPNDFTNPVVYTIIASDEETKQDWTINIKEDNSTGIIKELIPELKIYPNPFTNKATIEVANFHQSELYLSIYGSLGNIVLEKVVHNNSSITFSKDNLPDGAYLVYLRGEKLAIRKIVLIK